jgi:acetyl esterase/lipase
MKTKTFLLFFFLLTTLGMSRTWAQNTVYETLSDRPYYPESVCRQDSCIAQRCVLDVYYPRNSANFATVIWFHGGGLTGGEKFIPEQLKERGFGVVAVNYRLYPKAKCPQFIEDAAAAIAWVFAHIGEYGGDADKIIVAGHSAGAYLTGMVGLDKQRLRIHGLDANRIAGLFLLSPQVITHKAIREEQGIPETQPVVDQYAILYHVRPDTPPVYLMTGDRELEMLGRYEENAYLWRMLKITGNKHAVLYEFDGYGHDMTEPAFPLMIRLINELIQ